MSWRERRREESTFTLGETRKTPACEERRGDNVNFRVCGERGGEKSVHVGRGEERKARVCVKESRRLAFGERERELIY